MSTRGTATARAAGLLLTAGVTLLALGCASTSVVLSETAPPPGVLCQRPGEAPVHALVLWGVRWRPDQKDVPLRERAAEQGLQDFLAHAGCHATAELRRLDDPAPLTRAQAESLAHASVPGVGRVLQVTVRELGPVLKLGSSLALVEGGTEVVLDIGAHDLAPGGASHGFQVHWNNGGPGVVKGVASLPQDMRDALAAALGPTPRP